jgi:hypothetical protein
MRNVLIAVGAVLALQSQIDVTRLGPQVGAPAIEFRLQDQRGAERTLASLAGPKGTMLVFFRSADW